MRAFDESDPIKKYDPELVIGNETPCPLESTYVGVFEFISGSTIGRSVGGSMWRAFLPEVHSPSGLCRVFITFISELLERERTVLTPLSPQPESGVFEIVLIERIRRPASGKQLACGRRGRSLLPSSVNELADKAFFIDGYFLSFARF